MIPPQAEEFMANRIWAEVRRIASSHAVMVSRPQEVADLIALAVDSIAASENSVQLG